jgi:hypothetical protein
VTAYRELQLRRLDRRQLNRELRALSQGGRRHDLPNSPRRGRG